MGTPGFTAEFSLCNRDKSYRLTAAASPLSTRQAVMPQSPVMPRLLRAVGVPGKLSNCEEKCEAVELGGMVAIHCSILCVRPE